MVQPMARKTGAAVATLLGLGLLLFSYAELYPGFDTGALLAPPSLLFLGVALAGVVLFIAGAASLTEGLGPP